MQQQPTKNAGRRSIVRAYESWPQSAITTGLAVLPLCEPTPSIALTTSMPLVTEPKTTCLPSSQSVLTVQRKNLRVVPSTLRLSMLSQDHRSVCIRWGSNPRLRRDWGLNPTPSWLVVIDERPTRPRIQVNLFALEFALGCNRIVGEAIQPQEPCRRTLSKRGRGRGTSRTVASAVGAGLATSALGIAAGAMSALALAAIAARA